MYDGDPKSAGSSRLQSCGTRRHRLIWQTRLMLVPKVRHGSSDITGIRMDGVPVCEGFAAVGSNSLGHGRLLFDEFHSHLIPTDAASLSTRSKNRPLQALL
jgi:hypothetical protein